MKSMLIKTAVVTAALAFSPMALMAEDKPAASTAGQQPSSSSGASQSGSDSATVAGSRSQSDRSSSRLGGAFNEQKFVQKAMEGNQFEIQLGQLAQQKAQNQEVKKLAQMLVQDHQQANQTLTQASSGSSGAGAGVEARKQPGAQASGGSSSSGQGLGPVHQAMLTEFQQLEGAEFDQAYVHGQLAGHLKSILKYREASTQAQNPQIKQYASQSLPKLQAHFQQLQQLAGWDEATTASGSIQGDRSSPRSGADSQSDASGALSGTNSTDRNAAGGSSSSGASSGSSSSSDRTGGQSR